MLLPKYIHTLPRFCSILLVILVSISVLNPQSIPTNSFTQKSVPQVSANENCTVIFRGSFYWKTFVEVFTSTSLPGDISEYSLRNPQTGRSIRLGSAVRSDLRDYSGQYTNYLYTFNYSTNQSEYESMLAVGANTFELIRNDATVCSGSISLRPSEDTATPQSYPAPDCTRAAQNCDLNIFDIDSCETTLRSSCEASANGNNYSNFERCSTPFAPARFITAPSGTEGEALRPDPNFGINPNELTTCLTIKEEVLEERNLLPVGESRCPRCPEGFVISGNTSNPGSLSCRKTDSGSTGNTLTAQNLIIRPEYISCNTDQSCYLRGTGGCIDDNQACIPNQNLDGINPCAGDPSGRSFTCETAAGRQCCNTRAACELEGGSVEGCYVVGALATTGGAVNMCTQPFPIHCLRKKSQTEDESLCCRTTADCSAQNGDKTSDSPRNDPFLLCNQTTGKDKIECEKCLSTDSIWTSLGCISTDGSQTIRYLIVTALGLAGGIGLLMIIASGAMFTLSKNDPKKIGDAKDLLSSVIIGLLFIVFSVTILQFIGVTLLRIPGFGQ